MVRILIQGISLLTLLMHFSCRSNHTDRKEDISAEAPVTSKKATVPVAVSATELCAHFNSNSGSAISKYKDYILVLSGEVTQSKQETIDNNCCNIIMGCAATDKRDTGSLSIVIKHCRRDAIADDTISPGSTLNIHCRFIAYQDGVIQLEEVAAPK